MEIESQPCLMPIFCLVLNLEGLSGLTSILTHFNGVAVKPCIPHSLGLAPDDADRRVVLVLDEQIHGGAGGLYTADNTPPSSVPVRKVTDPNTRSIEQD